MIIIIIIFTVIHFYQMLSSPKLPGPTFFFGGMRNFAYLNMDNNINQPIGQYVAWVCSLHGHQLGNDDMSDKTLVFLFLALISQTVILLSSLSHTEVPLCCPTTDLPDSCAFSCLSLPSSATCCSSSSIKWPSVTSSIPLLGSTVSHVTFTLHFPDIYAPFVVLLHLFLAL